MSRDIGVSVIIPAWNSRYIADAMRSVPAALCGKATELIVVDDGSEDDTAVTAAAGGATVLQQSHKGAAAARNLGLRAAHGEYVMFLDSDDVLTDGALETLVTAVEDAGAVWSCGMSEDFVSPELPDHEKAQLRPRAAAYFGMITGCAVFRRSLFDAVGAFDETLTAGETVEFAARLHDRGVDAVRVDSVVLRRRIHMSNTGRIGKQQEKESYAAIIRRRLAERSGR